MLLNVSHLEVPLEWQKGLTIVYDGDCPLCSRYSVFAQLRLRFGPVRLVNARQEQHVAPMLLRHGIDLDQGMAVIFAGRLYFGADAMNFLARNGVGGTYNVMRNARFAGFIYPALRAGRNAMLRLLGHSKLNR